MIQTVENIHKETEFGSASPKDRLIDSEPLIASHRNKLPQTAWLCAELFRQLEGLSKTENLELLKKA